MRRASLPAIAALLVGIGGALATFDAPAFAQAPTAAQHEKAVAGARALAARGIEAFDQGDYATALRLFTDAEQLYATPQYRIYMGRSLARLGRLTRAAALFGAASTMAQPAAPPRGFVEAQKLARDELTDLRLRIPVLRLEVDGSIDAHLTVDGLEVDRAEREHVEVDPGDHIVRAAAKGFELWSQSVAVRERQASTVRILLTREAAPRPSVPPPTAPRPPADTPSPPVENLSHRGQLGIFARADVDALHPGARAALGVTYGVMEYFELGAAALVGKTLGLEPRMTTYFLRGVLKPFVDVGVPIFFVQGAHPGLRGSAGLAWDPLRHFGVFAQVGGAYFFSVPAGYVPGALLPALGVQGRL